MAVLFDVKRRNYRQKTLRLLSCYLFRPEVSKLNRMHELGENGQCTAKNITIFKSLCVGLFEICCSININGNI